MKHWSTNKLTVAVVLCDVVVAICVVVSLAILTHLLSGCKLEPANNPETPERSQAAKVAAVMAEAGITLPQVAAYLNTYGLDVINRSEFREWTWTPAPAGTNPVAYYVVNFRVATGTNSLRIYLPQTAGPYAIRVQAFDGTGLSGPWSYANVSAPGDLLPGVGQP